MAAKNGKAATMFLCFIHLFIESTQTMQVAGSLRRNTI